MPNRDTPPRERLRHILFAAIVSLAAASASAGVKYTVETDTTYEGDKHYRVEDVLIDADRARVDVRSGQRGKTQAAGYMLTTDAGSTWAVVEGPGAVCGKWDLAAYFRKAGSLLRKVESWFNVTVSQASVEVASREPGPAILGFATTHARVVAKLKGTGRILFFSREVQLEITDDVWFARELGVEPVEQRWLDAMKRTGYQRLDKMTGAMLDAGGGFVLKEKIVAVSRESHRKRKRVKVDEIRVTAFERIAPGSASGQLRPVAECKPVSEDKLEGAAKDLLKSIVKP